MNGSQRVPDADDRLGSWKEIASYLDRSVRTVLRWEQEEGLPVHRLAHEKRGTVYAYKSELDAWISGRGVVKPDSPWFTLRTAGILAAILAVIVGGAWVWAGRSVPKIRLTALAAAQGQEMAPAFSPDGKQVVYAWAPEGEKYPSLFVRLIGSSKLLQLTSGKYANYPAWSPDGHSIAYFGTPSGIYLIPALGGAERKLASVRASGRLSWFPDGKRLAIVDRDPETGFPSIFELTVDTGARRKLTSGVSEFGDRWPSVSPDGKTLGFWRSSAGAVMAIYLMPVAGGEPRQLTRFEEWALDFTWTRDGREVIYCARPQGFSTIWRISASGGTPQQVAAAGHDAEEPALAASGGLLAFTQYTRTRNLWRIVLDTSEAPRRLAATSRSQKNPQFSMDGKKLAFESTRSGWAEIWTSDSDGGNLTQVTSMGRLGSFAGTPRWSPDGDEIAFDARPGGNPDIYVIAAQGGTPRRITADPAEDVVPSFSRDGHWIYFTSKRGGDFQVWKAPRWGGAAMQVTRQGGFAPMESPDGRYLYFVDKNNPSSLWRTPTAGGPVTLVSEATRRLRNWTCWKITERGVVFVDADSSVKLLDPENGSISRLTQLPKFPADFTASPDGRIIIHSQLDQQTSNIMLLENFR